MPGTTTPLKSADPLSYATPAGDDACLVYDLRGTIHAANAAVCALLGYPHAQLLTRSMRDLRPDVPFARLRQGWHTVVANGAGQTVVPWTRADGQVVEVEVSARLLQRRPVRIAVIARDQTARQQAVHAHAHRYVQQLLDGLRECILVIDPHTFQLRDVNRATVDLTGYSRAELLTLTAADLRVPEERDALPRTAAAVLVSGGTATPAPVTWCCKDGRRVPMEFVTRVVDLGDGLVVVASGLDISERLRQAAALQLSEGRFRAVLDHAPAVVYAKDTAGRYLLVNRQFETLFGVSEADACGKTDAELVAPDLAAIYTANDRAVLAAGRAMEVQEYSPQPDGLHTYFTTKFPLRDAAGQVCGVAGISTDITALQQAEAQYRSIFESAREAIFRTTGQGTFAAANPATAALLGYATPAQLLAAVTALRTLFVEPHRYQDLLALLEQDGAVREFEVELKRRDGETRWVSLNLHRTDPANRRAGLQGTAIDVSARRLAETYRYQALHDPLTGLANRALFTEQLEQTLAAALSRRAPLAVLQLDLDGFKAVNDTYGHRMGDALLQQVAQRLQQAVRAADTVARLGGDEFSVLLPGTGVRGAIAMAQKLLASIRAPFDIEGEAIGVAMSVGIAVSPDHGRTGEALVRRADTAMYNAKLEGRGYAVSSAAARAALAG